MPRSLRLDPIACDGHALCAELLPEWIRLDDWGFPIVDPRPLPGRLEPHARLAVRECPKLALRLTEVDPLAGPPKPATRTTQAR